MAEKTEGEELKEKLFHKKENGWADASEEDKSNIYNYCEGYMEFLNKSKTDREIVHNAMEMAKTKGFREINESCRKEIQKSF